jgi:hypothetical protein
LALLWDAHLDDRAAFGPVGRVDGPTVSFHNRANDGQTQACTTLLSIAASVRPTERLERLLHKASRKARAAIRDAQGEPLPLPGGVDSHGSAGAGVADRVVEQVLQRLPQTRFVGACLQARLDERLDGDARAGDAAGESAAETSSPVPD